jgi:hypothetical protein
MQKRSAWFPRLFVCDEGLALSLFSFGSRDCFGVPSRMDSRCVFFELVVGKHVSDNTTGSRMFKFYNTIMLSMRVQSRCSYPRQVSRDSPLNPPTTKSKSIPLLLSFVGSTRHRIYTSSSERLESREHATSLRTRICSAVHIYTDQRIYIITPRIPFYIHVSFVFIHTQSTSYK